MSIIDKIQTNGKLDLPDFVEQIKALTLEEIQQLCNIADAKYYKTGQTVLTDAEYDCVKKHLRTLNPDDECLTRVGPTYSTDELHTKVNHNIPMGSLDNTDDGIIGYPDWYDSVCEKLNSQLDIYATLKVDGNSIDLRYENGMLTRAATRGNGTIGENVTANAAKFRNVPILLPEAFTGNVRGEAILYVKDFETVCASIPEEERSNPRNIGSGIIGRLDGTDSEYIRFMAFNILPDDKRDFVSEQNKFEYLKQLGFVPVPGRLCHSIDEFQHFYDGVVAERSALPFHVDGIVVKVNDIAGQSAMVTSDIKTLLRPKYARAVKFPHMSNTTIIRDCLITIGHTGAVIPTAELQEVRVGGVNVTHALLNNWDEINRLDVAIGDEVEVVLAGDIIPKIIRVVKRAPNRQLIVEPTKCPKCGTVTTRESRGGHGAVTYCANDNCPGVVLGKIHHWIGSSKKGVGILGIGDKIEYAMWENGLVADPADLYTLTVDQIENLTMDSGVRVGHSRAVEIIDNIASKRNLSLETFLGSLGVDLLGRRRVKLMRDAAEGQLDTLEDWLDDKKLADLQIKGLGNTIRHAIRKGINKNRELIAKLLSVGVTVEAASPVVQQSTDPDKLDLSMFSFCFTGTRECEEEVRAAGGVIKSGVSKGLDFLVQKDVTSQSKKTMKAESYGTKIISIDYLKRVLNKEAVLVKEQPVDV